MYSTRIVDEVRSKIDPTGCFNFEDFVISNETKSVTPISIATDRFSETYVII